MTVDESVCVYHPKTISTSHYMIHEKEAWAIRFMYVLYY